ncbi:MAG: HlyC/CorC family transporter [Clostridia bacterium]|nr:HlyC/CorC family transporter [Clostridia bacterium]
MDDPGSSISLLIFYFAMILCCGYFAGSETALSSVNRIHIMSHADNGDKRAVRVLYLLDNFDEALSTLLIGNNIVNIACTTAAVVIAGRALRNISAATAASVATVITTVLLFFLGEMLPKCYARYCNESFIKAVAPSLIFLIKVLKPLSVFFTFLAKTVSSPFKKKADKEVTVTEDELQTIVENISDEDDFSKETHELVKSALKFSDKQVKEIMVPWDKVTKIEAGTKVSEIPEIIKNTSHSRLPVMSREGEVRGVLQIRKFLRAYFENRRVILASVMDYPYFVKPDVNIDDLLTSLSNHRRNLAIVRRGDKLLGVITIEDILEELVGEIYDEEETGVTPRE